MARKYQEVIVQENKPGWNTITLPKKVMKWLGLKKSDKVGFEPYLGGIRIFKVE